MPNFELEIWNTNAEAQLLAEYQVIGAHDPAEKTSGTFRRELSGSISQPVDSGGSTTFGWRLLRSISFTMANVILCELPTVLAANDRVDAVRVMIGKVVASVAANVSTECIVEIEQALLGQCEQIAASCVASDGEKQAAENIEVRSTHLHRVRFFYFAFCSPLLLLVCFTQIPFNPDHLESRRLRTVSHVPLSLLRPTHSLHSGDISPLGPHQFCTQKPHTKHAAMTLHRLMGSYSLVAISSLVLWSHSA